MFSSSWSTTSCAGGGLAAQAERAQADCWHNRLGLRPHPLCHAAKASPLLNPQQVWHRHLLHHALPAAQSGVLGARVAGAGGLGWASCNKRAAGLAGHRGTCCILLMATCLWRVAPAGAGRFMPCPAWPLPRASSLPQLAPTCSLRSLWPNRKQTQNSSHLAPSPPLCSWATWCSWATSSSSSCSSSSTSRTGQRRWRRWALVQGRCASRPRAPAWPSLANAAAAPGEDAAVGWQRHNLLAQPLLDRAAGALLLRHILRAVHARLHRRLHQVRRTGWTHVHYLQLPMPHEHRVSSGADLATGWHAHCHECQCCARPPTHPLLQLSGHQQ